MIRIVGAGMAGLLAGCMLRDHEIIEKNGSLPNDRDEKRRQLMLYGFEDAKGSGEQL